MTATVLGSDERVGLAAAVALHAGLVAVLLLRPQTPPPPVPERVTVTIADTVALTDTATEPQARAAPEVAPARGEPAAATDRTPEPPTPVAPTPVAPAPPPPAPAPPPPAPSLSRPSVPAAPRAARVAPASVPAANKPAARTATPAVAAAPAKAAAPRPAPRSTAPVGASRIGSDFLAGVAGASGGDARTPPAAAIGPAVRASLSSAIARQLKPRWTAPQGADAELLVTVLAWELNPDGTLAGRPSVVRQDGITDANRAQAARHAEQAVRAVQLAAPFPLPPEYFAAWRHIRFSFDKRLAQ